MKAIINTKFGPNGVGLEIQDVPVPKPAKGELLVKVHCVSINPSDLLLLEDRYIGKVALPFVPGQLAIGTVIENNAGFMGSTMKGKTVWFSPGLERSGAWTEYALTDTDLAIPFNKKLKPEIAVNLGNALTAVGMIEEAQTLGAKAFVMNAAAGNLARFVSLYAKERGLDVLHIVRRKEQADELKAIGHEYVLSDDQPDYAEQLAAICAKIGATVFFDSVGGGDASNTVMEALPKGSTVYLVGVLSGENFSFYGLDMLMVRGLTLKAFVVLEWLEKKSLPMKLMTVQKAQKLLLNWQENHATQTAARKVSLEDVVSSFTELTTGTSAGKTLIYPNGIEN